MVALGQERNVTLELVGPCFAISTKKQKNKNSKKLVQREKRMKHMQPNSLEQTHRLVGPSIQKLLQTHQEYSLAAQQPRRWGDRSARECPLLRLLSVLTPAPLRQLARIQAQAPTRTPCAPTTPGYSSLVKNACNFLSWLPLPCLL